MTTSIPKLETFAGWWEHTYQLLADKPHGTALVYPATKTYLVILDGEICAFELDELDPLNPKGTYDSGEAMDVDARAWGDSSWAYSNVLETQEALINPRFVLLDIDRDIAFERSIPSAA